MPVWWKVTMPLQESGLDGRAHVLKEQFAKVYIANGAPAHAAMFWQSDSNFEACVTYFSPEAFHIASNLINPYKPTACAPPRRDQVKLAVGHSGTDKMILPEAV